MKIVFVSDTHAKHSEIKIPKGDLIICAGDMTPKGRLDHYESFLNWYSKLRHTHKILIAGNHDLGIEDKNLDMRSVCSNRGIVYLEDSYCVVNNNGEFIKIWGSPVTPQFGYGWAFNRSVTLEQSEDYVSKKLGWTYIKDHWDKIHPDTDILVTHGPPYKILDEAQNPDGTITHTGCPVLAQKIQELSNLKLHVFGHIHEAKGIHIRDKKIFVNASVLNRKYKIHTTRVYSLNWERIKNGKV